MNLERVGPATAKTARLAYFILTDKANPYSSPRFFSYQNKELMSCSNFSTEAQPPSPIAVLIRLNKEYEAKLLERVESPCFWFASADATTCFRRAPSCSSSSAEPTPLFQNKQVVDSIIK